MVISAKSILYLEGNYNYTIIHYLDGSKFISAYCLWRTAERFVSSTHFLRIHRRYFVNSSFVLGMESVNKKKKILLSTGIILDVSRRKEKELQQLLAK